MAELIYPRPLLQDGGLQLYERRLRPLRFAFGVVIAFHFDFFLKHFDDAVIDHGFFHPVDET